MVKTEIIDYEQAYLLTLVEEREDLAFEYLMAHHRMIVRLQPSLIFSFHKLAEIAVGITLLHQQQLSKGSVGIGKFQFPIHGDGTPPSILDGIRHIDERGYFLKFLLIVGRGLGGYKFVAVKILLY